MWWKAVHRIAFNTYILQIVTTESIIYTRTGILAISPWPKFHHITPAVIQVPFLRRTKKTWMSLIPALRKLLFQTGADSQRSQLHGQTQTEFIPTQNPATTAHWGSFSRRPANSVRRFSWARPRQQLVRVIPHSWAAFCVCRVLVPQGGGRVLSLYLCCRSPGAYQRVSDNPPLPFARLYLHAYSIYTISMQRNPWLNFISTDHNLLELLLFMLNGLIMAHKNVYTLTFIL